MLRSPLVELKKSVSGKILGIRRNLVILDELDKARHRGNLILSGQVSHIDGVKELLVGIQRPDTEAWTVDIVHIRDKRRWI